MNYELFHSSTPEMQEFLLRAYNEREKILMQENGLDLWLFVAKTGRFYVTFRTPDGEIHTVSQATDPDAPKAHLLTEEDEALFFNTLHELVADPSLPQEGSFTFRYYDLSKMIESHYRCVKNAEGGVEAVIGISQDVRETRSKIQQLLDHQRDQMRETHVQSASPKEALRIVLVDLTDYSFRLLQGTPQMRQAASMATDAVSFLQIAASQVISSEEDRERLAGFFDLDTLGDRLTHDRVISIRYNVEQYGSVLMRVSPACIEPDGRITQILIAIQIAQG